jgi:putative membrane protein
MARRDGWRDALASFAIIAVGSGTVATLGATTGRPFGPYEYTPFFGPRIGGVLPAAIPLIWYTILASGHYLVFHCLKPASRRLAALAVASWATLFDLAIEPFAACVKSYWVWQTTNVPTQNYLAWFLLSFLLARVVPWGRGPIDRFDPRPLTAAAAILFLAIIGRVAAHI